MAQFSKSWTFWVTVYLQINTVKYNADWEITNIYENLQIVWSQFVTDMLLFVYIQSTSNIYWFIGIQVCCQQIQTNSYLVTFDIRTSRSGIRWMNPKVKKNYLPLLSFNLSKGLVTLHSDFNPPKFGLFHLTGKTNSQKCRAEAIYLVVSVPSMNKLWVT